MANPATPTSAVPAPEARDRFQIQYELRIGVTGHRNLSEPEKVTDAVNALLRHIIDVLEGASRDPLGPHGSVRGGARRVDRVLTFLLNTATRWVCPTLNWVADIATRPLRGPDPPPHWPKVPMCTRWPDTSQQTPLKLTVISSLAKGADQIVARVVCSLVKHPEQRNRYLEAVLPLKQDEYETDFTDPADLDGFRELLALDRGKRNTTAGPTVICPLFPNDPDSNDPARTISRQMAYLKAGRHVVDTSEIVIAVWDRSRMPRPGGTEDTLRYALDSGRVVLWIDPTDLEAGPRLLRRDVQMDADGLRVEPLPSRARDLSINFHRLAGYNRDGAVDHRQLQRELDREATRLFTAERGAALPEKVRHVLVGALLPHVVRANHLGMRYGRLRNFSARLWPITAAVIVSLMAFQIIFLPAEHWLAWLELTFLFVGSVSYRVSLSDTWHEKWLNDRRLAEGLRTALFVTLVRQERKPDRLPDHVASPLPFYSPANAWFVATLKRVLTQEHRRIAKHLNLKDDRQRRTVAEFLRVEWILEQAAYHRRNTSKRKRLVRWAAHMRLLLIGALALVATLHGFGVGHSNITPAAWPFARLDLWVAFATVALPAWAAAFHVMLSLDDHERLADRSAHMVPLLDGLARRLERVGSARDLEECVNDAERILDLESAEFAESLTGRVPEFTG